jgi:hypothetical protein
MLSLFLVNSFQWARSKVIYRTGSFPDPRDEHDPTKTGPLEKSSPTKSTGPSSSVFFSEQRSSGPG